jgi:uncharacterized protein involved in exopolysaccharide biosynthesis
MSSDNEISVSDFFLLLGSIWKYVMSKWVYVVIVAFLFSITGFWYASKKKPIYTAEITFSPENDRSSGVSMYAGIAAQFGLDLGGGGGGAFEGENLIVFLKSRMLIEKALLSRVNNDLLINYYIKSHELEKDWQKDPSLKNVSFSSNNQGGLRVRDSLMNEIVKDIGEELVIERIDKKVNIVSVKIKDTDELFSKLFVEQLVNNGIQYYTAYRSQKTRENVQILQRQTDSVRSMLTGNIVSVAESNDLNVNPIRQIARTHVQRTQVDIQANGQLYGELAKQLELSKIALRKETPFVQIIDTPRLPLEKQRLGRFKTALLFGFVGAFLSIVFLLTKRLFKRENVRAI